MLDTGPAAPDGAVTGFGFEHAGVDEAIVEAYELHREPLRRWLAARTRDDDLAEELAHEAFIRLMRTLRAGVVIENPRAWLFHAAGNLLVSHVRHVRVEGRYMPAGPAFEALSAEAVAVANERMDHLQRVLERLSPGDRWLLVAAAAGEKGPRLAEGAGVSQVALRARLCRARRRLRAEVVLDPGSSLAPYVAVA
jgi:RNA polymerase sigma-70 factor, ECF subfamily